VDPRSASTIAAARQNEIKVRRTVVATTTRTRASPGDEVAEVFTGASVLRRRG
jgi:hypothetical protein